MRDIQLDFYLMNGSCPFIGRRSINGHCLRGALVETGLCPSIDFLMNSLRMSNVISPTVPIYRMLTDEWARTILVFRHSGDSNRRVRLCPSIDGSPTDGHKPIINSTSFLRQCPSIECLPMNGRVRALSKENRSMGTNRSQPVPICRPSTDEWAQTIQPFIEC